ENKLGLMNSAQKLNYEVNYDRPDGMNYFGWTQTDIDSLSKIDNRLDKVLFRKGKTQQHQLSASGGNDKTRFYLSGSIFDQEGIVLTTGLKRYTGRANIENTFGDFKVGLNTTLGYSRLTGTRENDQYIGSPLNAINWYNPYITLFDENGEYQDDYLQGQPNPLRELLENSGNADQIKGVGSAYIEFNVPWIKGLKARTLWGADFTNDEGMNYLDRTTNAGGQATGARGSLGRTYAKTFRYTGTTSLGYQRSIGDHDISAAIFNEIIQSKTESFGFTGYGLVGPFRNEAGITPGSTTNGYIPTVGGTATGSGLLSYFIDATYGFRKKYYLSAGARRDGSSRFGENRKYANFGQVGASWIISEENFMAGSQGWLSELKLKASYGSVGNQLGIGDFAARELLGPTVYNGVGGLLLNNLANPDLRWEKKLMFNSGIEFTFFQGRLGGTLEYYNNITSDLFLDRQLSRTSGFASINTNLGKLQNQGIEASLQGDVIKTKAFTWSLSANYTFNKNKILEQPGQPENINGLYINKEGERANSFYVNRYAGVDPQNGSALYYKKDGKTTTDIYDPSDAVIVGTIDPPHFGGVSTTIGFMGLELDVLVSYAFGNVIYNNDRVNVENPAYWYSRLTVDMLREWKQAGDVTDVPSAFNDFHPETTRFIEKGDYIRLRNVMLSYSLPKSLIGRWKVNNVRVFAQGQNLHVWHSFKGWDPEVTSGILGGAQYPQLKTVTFGLNLGL
ncbi:MAG TPA: SusC/RagA family TonB-linked outer membrane protein, partial [Flavitalea sp.]|nr:SusC/RagA family TonB-linked outer membrane protein [Flavitalea sp.]